MPGLLRTDGFRRLAIAAVIASLAGVTIGIVGVDADTPSGSSLDGVAAQPPSGPACGRESAATIAAVDQVAARRIYSGELDGTETRSDIAHVTDSTALLSALAQDNQPGVEAAVHALVYAPGWHIVRLRVVRGGRVLSDIGGPYIIAPVDGSLKWHGRIVGHFVMSVQDDVGYVKLETRFIGAPVEIYRNSGPLMGTVHPVPLNVISGATVSLAGRQFSPDVLTVKAFPTGTLHVALLVPSPGVATARRSCAAIRIQAWGSIARHLAARFRPLSAHYADLVSVLRANTGLRAYVISGSHRLAGGSGPRKLPVSGTVSFAGRRWWVYSWSPSAGVRVFLLTPGV